MVAGPLADFIFTVICSVVLFFLFFQLLKRATVVRRRRKKKDEKLRESLRVEQTQFEIDDFFKINRYSWDYVIVLPVYTEDAKISDAAKVWSLTRLVECISEAGLESRCVLSKASDQVYLYVRGSERRLLIEMDRIDMKAELDPDRLRDLMKAGGNGWAGLTYPDDEQKLPRQPGDLGERDDVDQLYGSFDYMYAAYDLDIDERFDIYKKHPRSILRSSGRLKLLLSILRDTGAGGAGIPLERLEHQKVITSHFPLHIGYELLMLQEEVMNMFGLPWNYPFDLIRDYFGEKVGLYFVWLCHYTSWLFPASIMGIIVWVDVVAESTYSANLVPFYAIFMAVWATLVQEFWKRKEANTALFWGMSDFETVEKERVDFSGEQVLSPVTRLPVKYFPTQRARFAKLVSCTVITCCITVVIAIIALLFLLKYYTILNPVVVAGVNIGPQLPGVANAVTILITDAIYSQIALYLNDRENHRTQTQYEDNLIGKTFAFQFVNSYASLVYIAFIKDYFGDDAARCIDRDCMKELSNALAAILIVRLLVGNIQEVGVPMFNNWLRARQARKVAKERGEAPASTLDTSYSVASQFTLEEYDAFYDSFADYLEMAVQYGYSCLWATAFPLAPFMSLVNNWLEIRVDSYKLTFVSRRPEPRGAQDIGTWQTILDLLGVCSILTNVGIICFTGDFLDDLDGDDAEVISSRFLIFIAFEHTLLFLAFLLGTLVPDVSEATQIQLERQEFVLSKVLLGAEDDGDEALSEMIKPGPVDLVVYKEEEAPDEELGL